MWKRASSDRLGWPLTAREDGPSHDEHDARRIPRHEIEPARGLPGPEGFQVGQPMSGGDEGTHDHQDLSEAHQSSMNPPTPFEIVRAAFRSFLGNQFYFPFL